MRQVREYDQSPDGDFLIHLAEGPDRGVVNREGSTYAACAADVVKALSGRFHERMIYASSGAVYGDEHAQPCGVEMPVVATDVYTTSKLINEQIVLQAGGGVLRLANVVGRGMSANTVVSDIIRQIPGHGPLHVRDDEPVRDFLAVSDAASAFRRFLEGRHRGIVNVGTGIGTSVRALAEMSLALAGEAAREVVATAPSGRRSMNILDISETTRLLGWAPALALADQLARLVEHGPGAEHAEA